MKLTNVTHYCKKNNLERRYNASLNKNKINEAKRTFYSSEKVSLFFKLAKKENIEINYKNYYEFLSEEFKNKYDCFMDLLKERCSVWTKLDPTIEEYSALVYLLKIFVVNPIDGKYKELEIETEIKEKFKDWTITEPTGVEDTNECWDLKLEKEGKYFCIQIKPMSFFKSTKRTSFSSLKKIIKASKTYNNSIFFMGKTTNKAPTIVKIRNKGKKGTKFINLNKFDIEKLTQEQIDYLAEKTMSEMLTEGC